VDVDEKVHEPTKLAAVFDTLVSQGFAAEEILRSSRHHMAGEGYRSCHRIQRRCQFQACVPPLDK
jgi:hypothetical protein